MTDLTALVGPLIGGLLVLIVFILTGIRDDLRGLITRVGEHDSYITALKLQGIRGLSK